MAQLVTLWIFAGVFIITVTVIFLLFLFLLLLLRFLIPFRCSLDPPIGYCIMVQTWPRSSSSRRPSILDVRLVFGCGLIGAVALYHGGCRRGVGRSRLSCKYMLVLRPADRFEAF